ncbi:uncharacterized protein LOC114734739 [Neltuma alba]|uniref:uncharacterized protein LOC114734739 n=1 Tax=Neltuma alba TaxID=207710 RepID=UPI0010A4D513|nr:uncharacterized protein LOC114734739 [Prosopis alba]
MNNKIIIFLYGSTAEDESYRPHRCSDPSAPFVFFFLFWLTNRTEKLFYRTLKNPHSSLLQNHCPVAFSISVCYPVNHSCYLPFSELSEDVREMTNEGSNTETLAPGEPNLFEVQLANRDHQEL